jgi:CRISPR-associated protein Csx16
VFLPEMDLARLAPGDCVYGVLPVDLACAVCECGARFFALVFDRYGSVRGGELSAEELESRGARFEEFFVERR